MGNSEQEELLTSWLSVIGAITLFWSPVERGIDQVVHALHRSQQESSRKKKPMTLSFKLKFVESNLPANFIPKAELENLISLTKKTVQIRDLCVHGMLEEFDETSIKIGKVQGKADDHKIEVFTIDRNRLNKSAGNMMLLSQSWVALANSLIALPKIG